MKHYRINEDDLQKLEMALPRICELSGQALNNPEAQVLFAEAKEIISNIRWDYGPPQAVEVLNAPHGGPIIRKSRK